MAEETAIAADSSRHVYDKNQQTERKLDMGEKVYKLMGGSGAWNIALGIVTITVGVVSGVLLIISGTKLLANRTKIIF